MIKIMLETWNLADESNLIYYYYMDEVALNNNKLFDFKIILNRSIRKKNVVPLSIVNYYEIEKECLEIQNKSRSEIFSFISTRTTTTYNYI